MSAPIGDAKSGGVGTLPPPQEQKTGRAKDQSQSGNTSPPKSGVAGLSGPAVSTLPAAQNTNAAPSLSAASPAAALVANCRDVDDVVKVLEGLTSRNQGAYAAEVVNRALLRFGNADDVNKLAKAVGDNSALRPIVVEHILRRAAELESKSTPENRDRSDGSHHQACAYVLAALKGMPGEELGSLIMSPKEGERLAKRLMSEIHRVSTVFCRRRVIKSCRR
jgi:hypothetical protein